jgi:hypothetical protein
MVAANLSRARGSLKESIAQEAVGLLPIAMDYTKLIEGQDQRGLRSYEW